MTYLDKSVNVECKRLRHAKDELVDTGYGMCPDPGRAVLEKVQKLRYHVIEGSLQSVRIQLLRTVLADVLQSTESSLF